MPTSMPPRSHPDRLRPGLSGIEEKRPIRVLTFSSLFPNAAQPNHGVFVENRLRHLLSSGQIDARVMAPVPWVPFGAAAIGHYATLARVPAAERRNGIDILHPRYPVVPKIGMSLAPLLMYAWTRGSVARLQRAGFDFDLIDAHYFYPDGIAAAMLGRTFGRPVTITARGTDINLIPRHPLARRMIRWAARHSAATIAVSRALKDAMVEIGLEGPRIHVLRNGVDLAMFRPSDGAGLRRELRVEPPVILSVGGLVPLKGHDLVIQALPRIDRAALLIAGQGREEGRLRQLSEGLGLSERVRFLGPVAHADLHRYYSAADVLVLASEREGWPNVLLEAMACGTPVAATRVGGISEVVTQPCAGRLIARRDPEAIAETVRAILADPPRRDATRAYAEGFGWEETTAGQLKLFRQILEKGGAL